MATETRLDEEDVEHFDVGGEEGVDVVVERGGGVVLGGTRGGFGGGIRGRRAAAFGEPEEAGMKGDGDGEHGERNGGEGGEGKSGALRGSRERVRSSSAEKLPGGQGAEEGGEDEEENGDAGIRGGGDCQGEGRQRQWPRPSAMERMRR